MSRFNNYFANDFASCRLLAYARDPHRGRDVRIYLMPGDLENVGITDGIDKWVCPVIANPFSVDIVKLVRMLCDGVPLPKPIPPGEARTTRRAVLFDHSAQAPKTGRRALLDDAETPATSRSRRVLTSI